MEKIKFEKSYNDGCGTSLQGYIHASYHELVEMFGEPQWQESGDGKCTFTFVIDYVIQSADGDDEDYGTFTLYDWKGNRPYDDSQSFKVHVGGKGFNDDYAATKAALIFDKTDTRYSFHKECMFNNQWFNMECA